MIKKIWECWLENSMFNLTKIEPNAYMQNGTLISFENLDLLMPRISRVFFLTSNHLPLQRGNHAHKKCRQLIFCVNGSAQILVKRGLESELKIDLRAKDNIYIPPFSWLEITMRASTNLMVLCDLPYEEADYIRDWADYLHKFEQK